MGIYALVRRFSASARAPPTLTGQIYTNHPQVIHSLHRSSGRPGLCYLSTKQGVGLPPADREQRHHPAPRPPCPHSRATPPPSRPAHHHPPPDQSAGGPYSCSDGGGPPV